MKVMIVDDEAPARALLAEYLEAHPDCQLVAQAAQGLEAVELAERHRPDLMLLDIQMPGLDGFEVIEALEHRPLVVFTTAYDEYALKAFEVGAVDYLLKPFSEERFAQAMERAAERLARGDHPALDSIVAAARRGRSPLSRVLLRHEGRLYVLPTERIDYIEARGDYASFHVGKEALAKQQSLGELEELLDPRQFARIHRSYLLNLSRLARFELYAKDSRVAILKDGTRLPVSRAGYARVRELAG
ncbi:MAG TPA: LytTR family DNA-binding domain-containing protein [Thermoanaerobaculia bacterium]|nr:LytTR family DNA-binding domain-containing protein [Thermoanaerobaculia bacterium]